MFMQKWHSWTKLRFLFLSATENIPKLFRNFHDVLKDKLVSVSLRAVLKKDKLVRVNQTSPTRTNQHRSLTKGKLARVNLKAVFEERPADKS